jgi:hypothetical protein
MPPLDIPAMVLLALKHSSSIEVLCYARNIHGLDALFILGTYYFAYSKLVSRGDL